MREIKFRLWDHASKIMLPVQKLDWEWGSLWAYISHVAQNGKVPNLHALTRIEVHSGIAELMEYTGLHDKNGKEIYEGDICEVVSISYGKRIGEVKFCRGCFIISFGEQADGYCSDILYVPLKVEVIGNRWENPELVKEQ